MRISLKPLRKSLRGGPPKKCPPVCKNSANVQSSLGFISFYSGAGTGTFFNALNTASFSPPELYPTPVPEPETYATAILLLVAGAYWTWRRRSAAKPALGPSRS